ncbi:MAG: hypothetical protein HYY18_16985 [Planctomycetes bacterium]|nr:hypothetical protein [Planctomycetota bacterium]
MRALALAALGALLSGCGYTVGEPVIEGAHSVAVPMVANASLRRGNEFGVGGHELDLTQAIRDMVLSRTGYRIAAEGDADLIATTEITDYDTPFLVEDVADRPLLSNVSIQVRLVIRRRDGTVVYEGTRREHGTFVPTRDQDESTGRAEAMEKLARWVVSRLEGGW